MTLPITGAEPPADAGQPSDGDQPLRVSTLELFFDLVFVFTITQLTVTAVGVTLSAAGEIALLTVIVAAALATDTVES